ncbi:MAG: NAD(P)-dependent oxidoreductase [Rhodobacteraceae bacterium]|nr:NAD(P)-dependent oxidoreductase [Paracoccaceae bacterium]
MTQKSVLLTGYTGFLGGHTVSAFKRAGWRVLLAGRSQAETRTDDAYFHIDLERPETILGLRELVRPDAIVHLACRVGWGGETLDQLYTENVLATACMAELARFWNVPLVFASAALVHGKSLENISSDSPGNPDTDYAKSKLLAEDTIRASGVSHCFLRMGGLFGGAGPSHLGLNRAIVDTQKGIAPTKVGRGEARRNYLYVKDAALQCVFALENRVEGSHLLAGSEVLSVGDMLEKICEVLGHDLHPRVKKGAEANDQIITSSIAFPKTRTFHDALIDIRESEGACASD